jgi:hypothetical protein
VVARRRGERAGGALFRAATVPQSFVFCLCGDVDRNVGVRVPPQVEEGLVGADCLLERSAPHRTRLKEAVDLRKPALVVGRAGKSQVLKVSRGAHVPRIRNDETSSLMKGAKGFAPSQARSWCLPSIGETASVVVL